MHPNTQAERSLVAKMGAETSWANTTDRTARTAPEPRTKPSFSSRPGSRVLFVL